MYLEITMLPANKPIATWPALYVEKGEFAICFP